MDADEMPCSEVVGHLTAYVDGELGSELAEGVRAHLEQCVECESLARVERAVITGLRNATSPLTPGQLRRWILETLRGEDSAGAA